MKYIELKIKNIASIEEATIDFAEEHFANEPIFLISGKTGSGKSTILDAISLALYKKTPRIEDAASGKYVDEYIKESGDSKITYADIRQYMKRGSKEASIEFKFEGNDGEEYTASVIFKFNRNNNADKAKWTLENNKTGQIYSKDGDIRAEINRIVGLDFDQFCRTSMLAQGKFTEFLKSDDKNKAIILEKITGTDIYSKIGKKIYEKKVEKEKIYEIEKGKMEGITLLTEDEMKANTDEQTEKSEQVKTQQVALVKLQEDQKWYEDLEKYEKSKIKAEEQKQQYENQQKSERYIENKTTLDLLKQTQTAREALRQLINNDKDKTKNQKEEKRLQDEFTKLIRHRAWQNEEIKKQQTQLDTIDKYLSGQAQHEPMYHQSSTILQQLKQCIGAEKEKRQQEKRYDDASKELIDIEKTLTQLNEEKTKIENEELIPLQNEITKLQNDKANYDADQISQAIINYNKQIAILKEETIALEQLQTAEEEHKETIKKLNDEQSKNDKLVEKEKEDKDELDKAVKQLGEAQKLYDDVKDSVGDYAKSLRATLKDGDKCPVCGKIIEGLKSDEEFAKMLQPLIEGRDKKTEEKDRISEQYNNTKLNLQASDNRLKELKETEKKNQKSEEDKQKTVEEKEKQLKENGLSVLTTGDNQTKISGYKAEQENIEKQLTTKQKEQTQYNTLIKNIEANQKKQDRVNKKIKEKEEKITKQNEDKNQKENEKKTSQELAQSKQKEIGKTTTELATTITYSDWKDISFGQLSERLKKDSEQYTNKEKEKTEKEKQIDVLNIATEKYKKTEETTLLTFASWKIEEPEPQEGEVDCIKFGNNIVLLSKAIETAEQIEKEQNDILKEEIGKLSITEQQLRELAAKTEEEIQSIEKYNKDIDQKYSEAKGAATQARNLLDEHKKHTPEKSKEELASLITETQNIITENNKRIGELCSRIKEDSENKKNYANQQTIVDKANEIKEQWTRLCSIFGDKEGTTFRKIAQSYVLRELLYHANNYMSKLNDRYELECQPNSLVIMIKDKYMGSFSRPVDYVSGGESFLVSLALALGLSSLNNNNITTDILFIDEGFGTLDPECLDMVMNTLCTLHELGGNRVGIISHVEELKERINAHIEVEKKNRTSSTVTVKVM